MVNITIELTTENLEQLEEGAERFGRCAIVVTTTEGVPVYLAVTQNHQPRKRKRAGASLERPAVEADAVQLVAGKGATHAG
jgi:hypothetical protein